ncbi:hypothetical protein D3C73_815120 [compost metagenome]
MERQTIVVPGSDRREILFNDELMREVNRFKSTLEVIEEELVFEAGMFSLEAYQLRIVEEHLEMLGLALGLLLKPEKPIAWVAEDEDGLTLVIMPKMVKEVLQERVFTQKMPIVFSSATLSLDTSFQYVADSLGVKSYLSFSVQSPYDYAHQMELIVPKLKESDLFTEKMKAAIHLLERTEGRALLLFPSKEELRQFKWAIAEYPISTSMTIRFEGDQEISHLISAFQREENSILCAVTLWEGLDIPGPSLSNVIIWSLPFPPNDPVYEAKRKAVLNPFEEVDMPYMLLRLRQGIGRLIRSREDQGIVAILGQELHYNELVQSRVKEILPTGVEWKELNTCS